MRFLKYVIGLATLWAIAEVAPAAEFFVAVEGDDASAGSQTQPFATLAQAQFTVRKLLTSNYAEDIVVTVGAGVYFLEAPLHFTAADGGRGDQSVIYRGVEGEGHMATLSGGRVLSDWSVGPDGKWQTEAVVTEASPRFRQLFADGRRLPRGRFPDEGKVLTILEIDDALQAIVVDQPLPDVHSVAGQGELVVHNEWGIARAPIVSIDGTTVTTSTAAGWLGHIPLTRATAGRPLYVENIPEYVDVEGEWCHDIALGKIFYQPSEEEKIGDRQFVTPRLSQLVVVEGRPGEPVRNLKFINLRFEMASWTLPDIGYSGIQAGHYGRSLGERTWELPAAIAFTFAEGCSLERSEVGRTGATAIAFGAGCRDNRVIECRIDDVGGNGVAIGWRGGGGSRIGELVGGKSLQADWKKREYTPTGNVIADNEIARCAQVAHGCVGIYDAFSQGTRIEHNHVHHLPYTGISVGYRWDFTVASHCDCLVDSNHIHDVMKILADGGGIYTLGTQPGTVLSNNVIYNVLPGRQADGDLNNGFFFDQGSKGYAVTGNCVYDVAGQPVRFNNVNQVAGEVVEFKNPLGKEAMLEWTGNVFGVMPGQPGFPQATVDAAGPRKR